MQLTRFLSIAISAIGLFSTNLISEAQTIVVDFSSDTTGNVSYFSSVNPNENKNLLFNNLEECSQALMDATNGNIKLEYVKIDKINNEYYTVFNYFTNNTNSKFDLLLKGDITGNKNFLIENCVGKIIFNEILFSSAESIMFRDCNLLELEHICCADNAIKH